jgi:hypothetical protein
MGGKRDSGIAVSSHPLSRCDLLFGLFPLFSMREYETDNLYAHPEGEKYCPDPDVFRRKKHQHGAKYE